MMLVRPTWMVMLLTSFGAMVALGAIPGSASALSSGVGDKTLHLLAYGFMTFLCFHSIKASRRGQSLISLLIMSLLGLLDEGLQSFLPYRNASLLDWCFDMAAAGTVILLLHLYEPASTRTN
jgi:VanZ family protein